MIYTITKHVVIGVEYQVDADSLSDAEEVLECADYSWFQTHEDIDNAIVRTEVISCRAITDSEAETLYTR